MKKRRNTEHTRRSLETLIHKYHGSHFSLSYERSSWKDSCREQLNCRKRPLNLSVNAFMNTMDVWAIKKTFFSPGGWWPKWQEQLSSTEIIAQRHTFLQCWNAAHNWQQGGSWTTSLACFRNLTLLQSL